MQYSDATSKRDRTMSKNQNNLNKGNEKGGDQKPKPPKNPSEQSQNDKKHNQQSRQPHVEFGTSPLPRRDRTDK